MKEKKLHILTYDHGGYVLARFCNYSDKANRIEFKPAVGKVTEETDLLGNKIADCRRRRYLKFRPWEIKTVKIEL